MEFSKIFDDQIKAAKETAILNNLHEVKVSVTLTFEFVLKKPEPDEIP